MKNDKYLRRRIWKMYKFVIGCAMIVMAFIFITNVPKNEQKVNMMEKYNARSIEDTGSPNVVTGIYLDYRLYDSLFESLLLLVTVSAISYINRTDFDTE